MENFSNVFQNYNYEHPELIGPQKTPVKLKGKWNQKYFPSSHPITLELACGRGEYTIGLAERHPNRNFIGIDIKGARMYQGAKYALEHELSNTAFLRTRIESIEHFFGYEEIDEIWITFPDPFLKKSKANRRLTHSFFIKKYQQFLKPGGSIHLKTDARPLFDFTLEEARRLPQLEIVKYNKDIYADRLPHPDLEIKTYYEKMHLERGRRITYIEMALI
ncbi:MAG: tRNA (guanosine(46)-N7)-methyltransferase TrmB [Bacteroidetes bacterium]|nr:tRNA (guanosine(46)-N7)-methyltransferase TrmB [Bacteroidota bacterium]